MRINVSENGKSLNVELPVEDAELAWQMKRLGYKNGNLCCTLETAWGEHSPLQRLVGQSINMDELNFFAKRFDSFTEYEQGVLGVYAYEQGMKEIKDLINLTYSMQGLSLLTDFPIRCRSGDTFTWINSQEYQKMRSGGLIFQNTDRGFWQKGTVKSFHMVYSWKTDLGCRRCITAGHFLNTGMIQERLWQFWK